MLCWHCVVCITSWDCTRSWNACVSVYAFSLVLLLTQLAPTHVFRKRVFQRKVFFAPFLNTVLSRTLLWCHIVYHPVKKSQCANFAPSAGLSKTIATAPFVKTPSLLQADILFTCQGPCECHLPNRGLWEQLADGGSVSAITITKPPY